MNLCKNCEHSRYNILLGWRYAKCVAPEAARISKSAARVLSPIDGRALDVDTSYCAVRRMFKSSAPGDCGSEGVLFEEARTSVLSRFFCGQ